MAIEGKCALITGASSGIGAATAMKLAAAGMKLGLAARRAARLEALKEEITALGGEAIALEMDVTNPANVEAGISKLVDTFGSLDLLFSNAGVMPVSDVDELQVDDWNSMIDVNIKGVLNTTASALPHMIRQRSGHIFTTSSIAGRRVFGQGYAVYSATKFAVSAFSEGLRMEVGKKHNVRVTCIQPGAVATELPDHTRDPEKRASLYRNREKMTYLAPDDIADAIAFAARAPDNVNVAELFILPTEQA
jgi:NADP-dependent 3-hydroxy acid dehydrogenase YdfG